MTDAKYIMRNHQNFEKPDELFYVIFDGNGNEIKSLSMLPEDAKVFATENLLEAISPAQYHRMISEEA